MRGIVFALTLIIVAAIFGLVDRDKDVPDPTFLSRDVFFQIGEDVISIPVVAVQDISVPPNNFNPLPSYYSSPIFGKGRTFATNEYKTAMISFATDPATPAKVSSILLSIGVYGSYGEHTGSSQICSLLTKTWSHKVCKNEFPDALKNIPRRFRLSTKDGLLRYRNVSFSGIPDLSGSDLLEAISPLSIQAKTSCNDEQDYCISALSISNDVYATWTTDCSKLTVENCDIVNIAAGNIIRDFVRNSLMVK